MEELDLTGLVLPRRAEVSQRSEDERTAQFVVTPLERGFGQTLGNAVRRTLLSSLPGAAVWGFRMDGVVHEHQTVSGVVEDVHQIIRALKSLVVTLDPGVEDAVLELRVVEAGPVTAASIKKTGPVTILNPDHHLFTLQEDRSVGLTLYVGRGRGFVAAEAHELPKDASVDLVRIDAIYNPVLRANFTVEATRVGQRTDFDELHLMVETDGSMLPEDAVAYASELTRRHFEFMLNFTEPQEEDLPFPGAVPVPEALRELLRSKLEDMEQLSSRSINSLKKVEIETLDELVRRTEEQILGIENFGAKSLEEILRFLEGYHLHLGMKLEEWNEGELYLVDTTVEEVEPAVKAAEELARRKAELEAEADSEAEAQEDSAGSDSDAAAEEDGDDK